MVTISPDSEYPRQILWAKVDESPNKHFPLVAGNSEHIYFCKSALKMAKIGTLRALAGQDLSPKIFKCGSGLSYGLGQSPQKEIFRFDHSWTSQWACENSTFSPVVHRDSRPPDAQNSLFLGIFCWFESL